MSKSKSLSSVVGRSWMLERKESSKDADEVEQPAASSQQPAAAAQAFGLE
tara:strand:- start:872 stop:1021 length:150 start_codon:yes stop_codon:yes gene_type:complete